MILRGNRIMACEALEVVYDCVIRTVPDKKFTERRKLNTRLKLRGDLGYDTDGVESLMDDVEATFSPPIHLPGLSSDYRSVGDLTRGCRTALREDGRYYLKGK
jgi:hypothetical protein